MDQEEMQVLKVQVQFLKQLFQHAVHPYLKEEVVMVDLVQHQKEL